MLCENLPKKKPTNDIIPTPFWLRLLMIIIIIIWQASNSLQQQPLVFLPSESQ